MHDEKGILSLGGVILAANGTMDRANTGLLSVLFSTLITSIPCSSSVLCFPPSLPVHVALLGFEAGILMWLTLLSNALVCSQKHVDSTEASMESSCDALAWAEVECVGVN